MTKNKTAFGSPLKEFIRLAITQINEALPEGFEIKDGIEFELTVVSVGEKEGGIDLVVLKAGGHSIKEKTHRRKFSLIKTNDIPSGPMPGVVVINTPDQI